MEIIDNIKGDFMEKKLTMKGLETEIKATDKLIVQTEKILKDLKGYKVYLESKKSLI